MLGGFVYMLKRIGPRTELWGKPQERGLEGDVNRRQGQRKSELMEIDD